MALRVLVAEPTTSKLFLTFLLKPFRLFGALSCAGVFGLPSLASFSLVGLWELRSAGAAVVCNLVAGPTTLNNFVLSSFSASWLLVPQLAASPSVTQNLRFL